MRNSEKKNPKYLKVVEVSSLSKKMGSFRISLYLFHLLRKKRWRPWKTCSLSLILSLSKTYLFFSLKPSIFFFWDFAMERPTVEHDFFALERAANLPRSSIRGLLSHSRSFDRLAIFLLPDSFSFFFFWRGILGFLSAIQRMNPVMVRSVMANPRPLPPPPPPPPPPAPAPVRSPSMLTLVPFFLF